jgi:hypothetical protein
VGCAYSIFLQIGQIRSAAGLCTPRVAYERCCGAPFLIYGLRVNEWSAILADVRSPLRASVLAPRGKGGQIRIGAFGNEGMGSRDQVESCNPERASGRSTSQLFGVIRVGHQHPVPPANRDDPGL